MHDSLKEQLQHLILFHPKFKRSHTIFVKRANVDMLCSTPIKRLLLDEATTEEVAEFNTQHKEMHEDFQEILIDMASKATGLTKEQLLHPVSKYPNIEKLIVGVDIDHSPITVMKTVSQGLTVGHIDPTKDWRVSDSGEFYHD